MVSRYLIFAEMASVEEEPGPANQLHGASDLEDRNSAASEWVETIFFFMLDDWCYLVNGFWLGINENGRPSIQLYLERHMFQVCGALQMALTQVGHSFAIFDALKSVQKQKVFFFFL